MKLLNGLRIGAVAMLIGRAWESIRWGGHIRDLFYNPDGIGGWIAEKKGISLAEIYSDHSYEHLLDWTANVMGMVFLLTAITILFWEQLKMLRWTIYPTFGFLMVTFIGLFMKRHFDEWGMLFEHSAQFFIIVCFVFLAKGLQKLSFNIAVLATAITFFCHGLYAIGYYPQPGKFADMLILTIGVNENTARSMLIGFAWYDFIYASALLLTLLEVVRSYLRNKRMSHIFMSTIMLYSIFWGFMTAIARMWSSYTEGQVIHWISQYGLEVLVRFPHFILPWFIWKIYQDKKLQT